MSAPIDSSIVALAEQIGEQIAVQLVERLRTGDVPVAPEYLTPVQVAQMTGFSLKALENYRARRAGPPFMKIGEGRNGAVRYRAADVRAWIEAGGPVE